MGIKLRYTRPAKIKQYEKQREFIDAPYRFTIVEATSKAGKTSGCIVWLFEQAISTYSSFYPSPFGLGFEFVKDGLLNKEGYNYWWVAPTYTVAKVAFRRLKRYIKNQELYTANESELTIMLINGATIFFKSGDKPDSLYGEDVHAVVIDEASRMKEESWTAILSTLTATDGACKIIGNVKSDTNWFYRLAREAEFGILQPNRKDPITGKDIETDKPVYKPKHNWKYFKITADDAVQAKVLDQKVIEDAKGSLPYGVFMELFFAIPFTKGGDVFAYSFDLEKHVKKVSFDEKYPLYLCFDFNISPISCVLIQLIDGVVRIPLVIQLDNSNIYAICKVIKTKFPGWEYIVNGDATGFNSNAMVGDGIDYYVIIKEQLDLGRGQIQVGATNPEISENQVLVNAVLEHIPHMIDPTGAAKLIFDLKNAKLGLDGKLLKKNRAKEAQKLEALDGYRYFVNKNLRPILKGYRNI